MSTEVSSKGTVAVGSTGAKTMQKRLPVVCISENGLSLSRLCFTMLRQVAKRGAKPFASVHNIRYYSSFRKRFGCILPLHIHLGGCSLQFINLTSVGGKLNV